MTRVFAALRAEVKALAGNNLVITYLWHIIATVSLYQLFIFESCICTWIIFGHFWPFLAIFGHFGPFFAIFSKSPNLPRFSLRFPDLISLFRFFKLHLTVGKCLLCFPALSWDVPRHACDLHLGLGLGEGGTICQMKALVVTHCHSLFCVSWGAWLFYSS